MPAEPALRQRRHASRPVLQHIGFAARCLERGRNFQGRTGRTGSGAQQLATRPASCAPGSGLHQGETAAAGTSKTPKYCHLNPGRRAQREICPNRTGVSSGRRGWEDCHFQTTCEASPRTIWRIWAQDLETLRLALEGSGFGDLGLGVFPASQAVRQVRQVGTSITPTRITTVHRKRGQRRHLF